MLGRYSLGEISRTWGNMPAEVKENWSIEDQFAWLQNSSMPPAPIGQGESAVLGPSSESTGPGSVLEPNVTVYTSEEQAAFEALHPESSVSTEPEIFERIFGDPVMVKFLKWGGIVGAAYAAAVLVFVIPSQVRKVRVEMVGRYHQTVSRLRRVRPKQQPKGFWGRMFAKPSAEKLGKRAEKRARRAWQS